MVQVKPQGHIGSCCNIVKHADMIPGKGLQSMISRFKCPDRFAARQVTTWELNYNTLQYRAVMMPPVEYFIPKGKWWSSIGKSWEKWLYLQIHWNPYTTCPDTMLYRIQRCCFFDSKWFSNKFQGIGRHKKFIYFCWYHHILTKIFSLVDKKTRHGERFIYKHVRILTKIFTLDEETDETSVRETNISSRLLKIHAFSG